MVVAFFTTFTNFGSDAEDGNAMFEDMGAITASITQTFLKQTWMYGEIPPLPITFAPELEAAFDDIEAASGLRLEDIASTIPDFMHANRWLYNLWPGLFDGLREDFFAAADSYDSKMPTFGGTEDSVKFVAYRILGTFLGMVEEVYVGCDYEWENPGSGKYSLNLYCTFPDGTVKMFPTYTELDPVNKLIADGCGIGSIGFNYNYGENYAYTVDDPWIMRHLGYNKIYDDLLLKSTMLNVDTVRLKFDWKGVPRMMQIWKGRYFCTSGGEIGLYNLTSPTEDLYSWYYSVGQDELVPMSFKVSALTPLGDRVLVDRPAQPHWWMTGFSIAETSYTAPRLKLESTITPPDAEFLTNLQAAFDEQIANRVKISYTLNPDGTLSFVW
jgi:hypothetical protein